MTAYDSHHNSMLPDLWYCDDLLPQVLWLPRYSAEEQCIFANRKRWFTLLWLGHANQLGLIVFWKLLECRKKVRSALFLVKGGTINQHIKVCQPAAKFLYVLSMA